MGALDTLMSRHSTPSKLLGEPGPNDAQLMDMLRAAVQVPDHGKLTPWRFERLEPGRSIQLDVECRAERAAASACGRVTVTAQEGVREEALTCLKVEAGR